MLFILSAVFLTMLFTAIPVLMTTNCLKRKAYLSLTAMYIFAFVASTIVIMSAMDTVISL